MFKPKRKDVLEHHKKTLINHLFCSEKLGIPKVLFKNEAENFIRKHAKDGKTVNINKTSGYFVREFDNTEGLDPKDIRIGVVCILNNNVGTLAHELRHAYQWQKYPKLFPNTLESKKRYEDSINAFNKSEYYNFPAEKDAFTFAIQYLNTLNGAFWLTKFIYRWKVASNKNIMKLSIFLIVALFIFYIALNVCLNGLLLSEININRINIFSLPILCFISLIVAFRISLDNEHYKKLEING